MNASLAVSMVPISVAGAALIGAAPAAASDTGVQACPPEGDTTRYTFTNISTSSRPTDLYSAYITGLGTITFTENTTATVGFTASASVTAEAGVVFAKASATIGVSVTAQRSWTSGFSYALPVPDGQRRRMRLFQESRSFLVKKENWSSGLCTFTVAYSGQSANAPRTTRVDEWKLEA
ncbi:hypothetical protein ACFPIJ_39600 [Dactylosporangium cerinum]|uniref:Uncharacterized protein n=1 Tax=Dactylosporangium cerinum TaxID=1434730 RepID=A0ABV9W9C3_9ACTN